MKQRIAIVLFLSVIISGCGFFGERIMEPVTFYYLQTDYTFGREPRVIVPEEREASGHKADLSYLLTLYLMGPAEEEHRTPLPSGTQILNVKYRGNTVSMELSNSVYVLSDAELTLACACLTLTCLDITDAQQVSITYQDRTVTMSGDSLTLIDDKIETMNTEEIQ